MVDKYNKPKNREERIQRLETIRAGLKEKFVGLDNIIDQIISSITPWYVTPEIIERPVVISLWGMTGTGKSSVIRELVEQLGLSGKSLFYDCGLENNFAASSGISRKICDLLSTDEAEKSVDKFSQDLVFILDEFQYARTLDESGCEVDKPNLRPIWSMIDNGILDINDNTYELSSTTNFIEDFAGLAKTYPDIKINNMVIEDPEDVKKALSVLGYFYYNRGVPDVMKPRLNRYTGISDEGSEMTEEEKLSPLSILEDYVLRFIIRRLGMISPDHKASQIVAELNSCTTAREFSDKLQEYETMIMAPRYLDCSKALVFIVGNLDEAFKVEGDLNPDVDADIFYDETSKVTISDIKNALKKRFRAEQIARFGNSLIKYPTLKKEHFQKIIRKEVERLCTSFETISEKKIRLGDRMYDLLYFESVFPVQGVRPVFTTIGTILSPIFSDILLHFKNSKDIIIDVKSPEGSTYKVPDATLLIKGDEKEEYIEKNIHLELGELRSPKRIKTRFINGVHETGHAIMMAWCTGKLPDKIVGVAAEGGGFCITYDSDRTGEIPTKEDIRNDIMIGLGGYYAEKVMFGDTPRLNLLGSGSDLEGVWYSFSDVAYYSGYFAPSLYSNYQIQAGRGIPDGLEDKDLQNLIKKELDDLGKEVVKVLEKNKKLIAECALWIGEHGEMEKEMFKDYLDKFGDFKSTYLEERRGELDVLKNSEKILRGI